MAWFIGLLALATVLLLVRLDQWAGALFTIVIPVDQPLASEGVS